MIPDITQFSAITEDLFGVGCDAPTEMYRSSKYNEVGFCRICALVDFPVTSAVRSPAQFARTSVLAAQKSACSRRTGF